MLHSTAVSVEEVPAVRLAGVEKRFGSFSAVKGVDLEFRSGAFTTLLGPSGCGKTTILRMIAGLDSPSAGDIVIMGRRVNDLPIHKRNIGFVFQNYALFPHKTVFENVAFGLRYRGLPKSEIRDRVAAELAMVRLPGIENRYPAQLSGGMQQRVALARALIVEPDVLLLDEPLSALDAKLRVEMREELQRIQASIGVTTIFVTHDQEEALSMSDEIVVLRFGRVEQRGDALSIYERPRTPFVAEFMGRGNSMTVSIDDVAGGRAIIGSPVFGRRAITMDAPPAAGSRARLFVRAEKTRISEARPGSGQDAGDEDPIVLRGAVGSVEYLGALIRYVVRCDADDFLVTRLAGDAVLSPGASVTVSFSPQDAVLVAEQADPDEGGNSEGDTSC